MTARTHTHTHTGGNLTAASGASTNQYKGDTWWPESTAGEQKYRFYVLCALVCVCVCVCMHDTRTHTTDVQSHSLQTQFFSLVETLLFVSSITEGFFYRLSLEVVAVDEALATPPVDVERTVGLWVTKFFSFFVPLLNLQNQHPLYFFPLQLNETFHNWSRSVQVEQLR